MTVTTATITKTMAVVEREEKSTTMTFLEKQDGKHGLKEKKLRQKEKKKQTKEKRKQKKR